MALRPANELSDAADNSVLQLRNVVQRMAEANKAFAHHVGNRSQHTAGASGKSPPLDNLT